jgi:DNA polymerase III subunit chi
MTEVKFFYNVKDKLHFACKLAKRAADDGRRLIVFAPAPALAEEVDRMLWTFSQLSFVPHVRSGHALAAETPIVIAENESGLIHHEALLNLGDEPPAFFSRFELLREIVSQDEEDKRLARERAKFYKSRGFEIVNQDVTKPA